MGRITQKEPNGRWWIQGVDFAALPSAAYGALCKLLNYEDTGLSPDEVERMKDDAKEIHIGSEIQGYEVYGIYKEVCIAYNRNLHGYAVWHIDADKCGVYGGNYYDNEQDAERRFVELAFSSNWQTCRWIDCSEQLPPEQENKPEYTEEYPEYLVIVKGFDTSTVLRYLGAGEWSDEAGYRYDVESWMLMPG